VMTDIFFPKSLISRIKITGKEDQVLSDLTISSIPSFKKAG
jgi:hypothetical protein